MDIALTRGVVAKEPECARLRRHLPRDRGVRTPVLLSPVNRDTSDSAVPTEEVSSALWALWVLLALLRRERFRGGSNSDDSSAAGELPSSGGGRVPLRGPAESWGLWPPGLRPPVGRA
jgi:hypothetical protein